MHQHIHYAYRGIGLKILSFYEYCAIIRICKRTNKPDKSFVFQDDINEHDDIVSTASVTKESSDDSDHNDHDNDDDDNDDSNVFVRKDLQHENSNLQNDFIQEPGKKSRQKNQCFEFDEHHPLQGAYYQQIRSKLLVPILAGRAPPYLGIPPPDFEYNTTWKKNSDRFAEYYLTLMVPWDVYDRVPELLIDSSDCEPLSYECFCNWANRNRNPNSSFINRCRFTSIETIATSLRVDKIRKKTVTVWRAQSAKRWNDGIGGSSVRVPDDIGSLMVSNEDDVVDHPIDDTQDIINYLQDLAQTTTPKPKNLIASQFLESQSKELSNLFSSIETTASVIQSGTNYTLKYQITHK